MIVKTENGTSEITSCLKNKHRQIPLQQIYLSDKLSRNYFQREVRRFFSLTDCTSNEMY